MHEVFLLCKFRQKYYNDCNDPLSRQFTLFCLTYSKRNELETDAPTDNRGKGERFSPTDLVCTALATCMITTMAMKATDMNIELKGTLIELKKNMLSDPRRIGKIDISLFLPKELFLSEKERIILERTGNNCPVIKSLHPDIILNIEYHWN